VYLVGLVAWTVYVILYPPWIGRSYNPELGQPGSYRRGGVFGLNDGNARAPLWDPPEAHSERINAEVRWPWQPVRHIAHVELSLAGIACRLSLGVLVLGLALRAWARFAVGGRPDAFVQTAWSLSLSLIIAWLCVLAIGIFTFGYGLSGGVVITVLGLGLVGGLLYSVSAFGRIQSRASTPGAANNPPSEEAVSAGDEDARSRGAVSGLLGFAVGTILAFLLTLVAAGAASPFRGPVLGVSELGTTRYARDQTPVNVVTGLCILVAGWAAGLLMRRHPALRGMAAGLIAGATVLGVVFALWH
jgi:hypothetical protein